MFRCPLVIVGLLMVAASASADPMTFSLVSDGGMLIGSEWIAAEGEIMEDSVERLEKETAATPHVQFRVRLNSPGGNLIGAIKLGEWLRKHKFDTKVGSTRPDRYGHSERSTGICASACAFAFIGGVERDASAGEVGVHQFYNAMALNDPSAKMFTALDMSANQFVSALLVDYVYRMGVDPRFVSVAASTRPGEMHFFSEQELESLKVKWRPKEFEPWSIEPSGSGVIAFTKTRDKSRTAAFFCRKDGLPRLFVRTDYADLEWYKDAIKSVRSVEAFDIEMRSGAVSLRNVQGSPALEYILKDFSPKNIPSVKRFAVAADAHRNSMPAFFFEFPKKNAETTMTIALKNCI